MATRVYGASDDMIEFEGDLRGEVGSFDTDGTYDMGVLVAFSDGTILSVKYGKNGMAVWGIVALRKGAMLISISIYDASEEADPHSDVAHFRDGPLKAWAASACKAVS